MSISIIILAAGRGTRLNSAVPKVFHEVGNLPIIFHVINSAKKLLPNEIVLVIGKNMLAYKKQILNLYPDVKICIQEEQKGTAHAVMCCIKKINHRNKNTIILYADSPLITKNSITKLSKNILSKKSELCLLAMKAEIQDHYGRLILDKKKNVKKIVEFSDANFQEKKITLCNSGVMSFKTATLLSHLDKISNKNIKKEFYLTDLVEILNIAQKNISFEVCKIEETLGINTREDLSNVEKIFQKNKLDSLRNRGVTVMDPNSTFFSYDTKISKDCIVYPNVYFGLGVNIAKNVRIKSFSHLEGVDIKKNCEIGPFARIRPETTVAEGVRIGNFVEIKKSAISKGAKVAHLSYIGDSRIGSETNIGAGSITCNFDGYKKNKTTIGSNCFIGSNTSLIAPLNIGDYSVIGAGTVLKENVGKKTIVFRQSKVIKKNK